MTQPLVAAIPAHGQLIRCHEAPPLDPVPTGSGSKTGTPFSLLGQEDKRRPARAP